MMLGVQGKNFFRLCLKEIQQKLFENGLRELKPEEYEFAGTIMALSILQNGPTPRFIPEEILKEIFQRILQGHALQSFGKDS